MGEHLPYKQGVIGSSPIVPTRMREWLSGRALPCQGKCREFESRFPLQVRATKKIQPIKTPILSEFFHIKTAVNYYHFS